jgi:hypothetical protein
MGHWILPMHPECNVYFNSSISQQIWHTMSLNIVPLVVSRNTYIIVWIVRLIIPVQSLQLHCIIIRSAGSVYYVPSTSVAEWYPQPLPMQQDLSRKRKFKQC